MYQNAKILIIDNEQKSLDDLTEILDELNIEAICAATLEDALRESSVHNFALIISNFNIPEVAGYELFLTLRNKIKTKNTPIIFISNTHKPKFPIAKSVIRGLVDFTFKPINPEILLGKVTTFLKLYIQEQELVEYREEIKDLKKKAVVALDAKSAFLSVMSHEVRTPLNAVLGFAEILHENEKDKDKIKYLDLIQKSGDGLLHIIDDILNLAKLDAGMIQVDNMEFDLHHFLQSSIEIYQQEADKKGINLILDFEDDLKGLFLGDAHRLRQVVINLIGNAIKFTSTGEVVLKVFKQVEPKVCFQIIDNGIGIKDEHINKVFDSFSQAEISTTRTYGGTGLGLTIVKKIVDLCKGEIFVTSVYGEGTVFSLIIPLPEVKEEGRSVGPSKEILKEVDFSILKNLRVLVCDDDESNTLLIGKFLEKYDCKYKCAEDGKEGLELYKNDVFDIVLMDINMPVMSGIDSMLQIRNIEKEKKSEHIPIIALTANVLEEDVKFYLESGFDMHLPKPIKSKKLIKAMISLIEKKNVIIKSA
jgi:signal transduction histidine kinase/ActR/RegA family two-component response regulator